MKKMMAGGAASATAAQPSGRTSQTKRKSRGYSGVEIRPAAMKPSIDPRKIVEAIYFVMQNDETTVKK